jgi:hypothetical protein
MKKGRHAGESVAIDDSNSMILTLKMGVCHGIENFRVFPDSPWLDKEYIVHDLEAISTARPANPRSQLPSNRWSAS